MKTSLRFLLTLLGISLLFGLCAHAQTPPDAHDRLPTKPILRIETGMHTTSIWCIATDAANRFLVTGSQDRTVRVWNLATGELLRVLRPPIGPGDEGKIYAVAISPNGNTIACGGATGNTGKPSGFAAFYLFDCSSGQMVRRIMWLPNGISQLVFSPDGHYLAATLFGRNGLRVYRLPQYKEVAKDSDYGETSYGADFAADGRLVTTCLDGHVRLYDSAFRLTARQRAPGGKEPYHVAFSPDGSKIAVGFADSIEVNVLLAHDLSLLYAPKSNRNAAKVTFSADGKRLYAGGIGSSSIRVWEQAGRGAWRDVVAAHFGIRHILPLRAGGIVYGAADSAWGVFDAAGTQRLFQTDGKVDLRHLQHKFLVSQDGSQFQFGYELLGKSPVMFSATARELVLSPAESTAMAAPVTSTNGLWITNWKGTRVPALNGQRLKLRDYETSRSLAIAPDGQSFLLGTEWRLWLFDRSGRERWNVPVPAVASSVNIVGDGRVAMAALRDGTIRWYRLKDGRELMAFFLHADRKRWVLWTLSGFYDCAPGAEDLIGWHVNNGVDKAADFYPVSRFRNTFYRPDVVAKMLNTLDEAEALRLADAEANRKTTETVSIEKILPPTVTILSPQLDDTVTTEEIEVCYATGGGSLDAAVTSVVAMVDGRPLEGNRGVKLVSETAAGGQTIRVPIPRRDCVVSLHAKNRHGVSETAYVRLKWGGTAQSVTKPKLYALVVGVSAYEAAELQLRYAAKDAGDFGTVLDKQKGGLYREVEMKLLTDKQAMRDEVLSGLKWLSQQTTPNDVAVLFLAGHGVNDTDGSYYYLPVNALTKNLSQTGVRFSEIREALAKITGKALFFVDTCHAGGVLGNRRSVEDLTRLMNEASSAENGVVVFASSTSQQSSLEKDEWHNGAFTKALVEGIRGEAASKVTGLITVKSLDSWLSDKVEQLTGTNQTPTTVWPKGTFDFKNFPVAVPLDKAGLVPGGENRPNK